MNTMVVPYLEGFPKKFTIAINSQTVTVWVMCAIVRCPFVQESFQGKFRAIDITSLLQLHSGPFRQAIQVITM